MRWEVDTTASQCYSQPEGSERIERRETMNDTAKRLNTTQREIRTEVEGASIHWLRRKDDWRRQPVKARIYVSASEFNVLEDLANRARRPYDVWRPRVLAVLEALGFPNLKIRWSQNAGCSCACSPGFVVENGAHVGLFDGDLWITLTDAPSVDESKPARILIGE